jgi:hypothetical protein
MTNCIVCETPDTTRHPGPHSNRFECPRCGVFALSYGAEVDLPEYFTEKPIRRSMMSHTLRRMQRPEDGRLHVIQTDELPTFWRMDRLPTPMEQADNLILWIGDNQPAPSEWIYKARTVIAATVGLLITGNNDAGGGSWLNSQLAPKELYLLQPTSQPGRFKLQLTMSGWERYETLKRSIINSRTAFVAMKFGDPILDRVVDECFKPAVARTGFELRKLNDQQGAGLIDDQIKAAIISGRFVIADLSHGNNGAYWEAGFAEGLGRPVLYTCEKSVWVRQKTHFDTNHMVTIIWDTANLKQAENAIASNIRVTLRAEAKQTDD